MNTFRPRILPAGFLILALSTSVDLRAQTAPSAPKTTEEAVVLTAFTVAAEANRGYAASETLTGSRVATKIVDLPYSVNFVTSEFLREFGVFELDDTITQIGSFTGLTNGGVFFLRGFRANYQLRDGFIRIGRFGASNVDRIEIIKGSNAAIYGRSSPGGMINMVSKQPKAKESYTLDLVAGSYRQRLASLEATGSKSWAGGRTSYIFNGTQSSRDFMQENAVQRNTELYLALKHEFADGASLLVSAEYFLQIRRAPTLATPFVTDLKGTASNLDDEVVGFATKLGRYDAVGPKGEVNKGYTSLSSIYEKRLNSVWSTRMGGNFYRSRSWQYSANTPFGNITINPAVAAPITSTRANTPNKQLFFEDGGSFQADVLATYRLFGGAVENRTLATLDFNDYYGWFPNWSYGAANNPDIVAWNAAGSGRVVTLNPDYTPVAPIAYFPKEFQWGQHGTVFIRRYRTTVVGGLLRHQSALLEGRLLAFAGVRFDVLRAQSRDFSGAANTVNIYPGYENYTPGDRISKNFTALKPNFGVNYKLTPGLRVFANYSESFFTSIGILPPILADPDFKVEVASGYDYGIKGEFFQSRLNFTLCGFYADRENVTVTDIQESPPGSGSFITTTRRDGSQLVRGVEFDINWNFTDQLSLNGSWGYVYSIYTDFGRASPLAVGRRVNGVSPQNGGVSLRYAPQRGTLKGLSANVGFTYVAATPTENPDAGDTYTTTADGRRVLVRTTRQWALRVPSSMVWNAGIRYLLKTRSGFTHTLGLNVRNAFDLEYLKASKQLGDRRSFVVSDTIRF